MGDFNANGPGCGEACLGLLASSLMADFSLGIRPKSLIDFRSAATLTLQELQLDEVAELELDLELPLEEFELVLEARELLLSGVLLFDPELDLFRGVFTLGVSIRSKVIPS